MKKPISILMCLFVFAAHPGSVTAQDFDEDTELLEEAEEIPPPTPPDDIGSFDNGNSGNGNAAPPPPPPSRFRPSQRFGAPTRPSPTGSSDSGSSSGGTFNPTTVPAAGTTKPVKGKMPFADAQPEDITNKNFPDIVESFDYKDAPIQDVVNAMARLTGKNFIYEQALSGKITIIAPRRITVAEAWETFLSALAMNNYTVVPAGKFLKIRKIDDAKSDSLDLYTGSYYPNADQLITRILRLKYINADDVAKTFDKIIKSKAGQVVAYEKTNSLIITDLGSNVERISRVLEELDKPGFEEKLEVIAIKNAKAKDLAELVMKIINKGEDKKQNTFRPASRFGQQEKNEALSLVTPDERTNSIIIVGNTEGIERIRKLIAQLDYPLDPSEASGVFVYYVKHGEAKKIAETLSGIAQEQEKKQQQSTPPADPNNPAAFKPPQAKAGLFGGDVIMKADENTNSLIITADKQDYQTVLNLLNKIDIPKDQVYVQAYIVEMDASKTDNWSFSVLKFKGDSNTANANANNAARAGYILGDPSKLQNIGATGGVFGFGSGDKVAINLPGAGGAAGQTVTVPSLLGLIEFIKTTTSGNVLSTPQIMAMDNEEALIEVGDEVPVGLAQSTANNVTSQTPQFKDATILLKLKPFISPDSDIVTLNIEQKANDISTKTPPAGSQLASVSQSIKKRTVKTNLTLKSGDTAVLGGLMQDTDILTEKKIPFLGDIPVLGWLFKGRESTRRKTNLMVFLSPKIVRNSQDHKKLVHDKFLERIDWVKKHAAGRDPFGESLQKIAKYAESPDEFGLEDQRLGAPIDMNREKDIEEDSEPEVIDSNPNGVEIIQ